MSQKRCFFNVLKCPTTVGLRCCALVGSFKDENEAKEYEEEESSRIDKDNFIVLIKKLQYEA